MDTVHVRQHVDGFDNDIDANLTPITPERLSFVEYEIKVCRQLTISRRIQRVRRSEQEYWLYY